VTNTPSTPRYPADAPPLRSLMFVPGGRPDMFEKARRSAADAVAIDLEDSVPEDAKAEARRNVVAALDAGWSAPPLAVIRINPPTSPHWQDDLDAAVRPGLEAILVPKVDSETEVTTIATAIDNLEADRHLKKGSTKLFLLIETPAALLHLESLILASPRVALLALGSEDLCLRTGAIRSEDDRELLFARSLVVTAAAAYGCLAFDGVHMRFRDTAALAREAAQARKLGFAGKLCVHPIQVDSIHRAFAPTAEELDWARQILKIAADMESRGSGAVGWKGELVDAPVIARARRILASAQAAPSSPEPKS
jgi:citrate lyase subunit beta/citryl-CoA lyase